MYRMWLGLIWQGTLSWNFDERNNIWIDYILRCSPHSHIYTPCLWHVGCNSFDFVCLSVCVSISLSRLNGRTYRLRFWHVGQVEGYHIVPSGFSGWGYEISFICLYLCVCVSSVYGLSRRGTESCNSCIYCKMTISSCILRALKIVLYLSLKSPFKSPVFLTKVSCIFPSNLL